MMTHKLPQAIPKTGPGLLFLLFLLAIVPVQAEDETQFGSAKRTAGALIGILYDLLDQNGRGCRWTDFFEKSVAQFVESGYDEGLINKYYRVPRALYTTQLQIPTIDAGSAPEAFGVENRRAAKSGWSITKARSPRPRMANTGSSATPTILSLSPSMAKPLVAEMPGTPMGVKWFGQGGCPDRFQAAGDWIPFVRVNRWILT